MRKRPSPSTATKSSMRLSPVRLVVACAIVAGLVGASVFVVQHSVDRFSPRDQIPFAPYVDVTLPPFVHFEDPEVIDAPLISLGFVVAGAEPCEPTWGSYYSLDAASRTLDLDRRISNLRGQGADVVVSFGGQANNELAVTCTDVDALTTAYQTVIDQYDARHLDFDIEGEALGDSAANSRRIMALENLQAQREDDGLEPLEIWFTLPVAPSGLTAEGLAVAEGAIAADFPIGGINVMTMNFGDSRISGSSMAEASVDALNATFQQLQHRFTDAGVSPDAMWSRLGATPMLGQNDVTSDVFTTSDARELADYASKTGLGRLGVWSINRDQQCGQTSRDNGAQNHCSGVEQRTNEFTSILGNVSLEREPIGLAEASDSPKPDDPTTSPYPIWRSAAVYDEGDKIVWQRSVYEAKWWSQGDQPDEPVDEVWDTPWRYLGPVLALDAALIAERPPVLDGLWAGWQSERVYVEGDEIQHRGEVFVARWWTHGDEPSLSPTSPFDHPWDYLGEAKSAVAPDERPRLNGTFNSWNADELYNEGDVVADGGKAYSAEWNVAGTRPEFEPDRPFDHPWRYLGEVGEASA